MAKIIAVKLTEDDERAVNMERATPVQGFCALTGFAATDYVA